MAYIRNFFVLAIASTLMSCTTPAASSFQADEHAIVDKLANEALLYAKREESPVSGLSLAVYKAGKPIMTKGYGTADISNNIAVNSHTIFRIGSITKQFTAAGIMSLVEDGKLELDKSASAYLLNVEKLPKEITIRHLLNNTSGIPDFFILKDWDQIENSELSRLELVSKFLSLPRKHKAGEKYDYSNSNYYLLGLIIEQVSGFNYETFVAERLAKRAGLQNTAYCSDRADSQQFAKGYIVNNKKNEPAKPFNPEHPFSAGGLCSTANDLALWTLALSKGKVVSPNSYAQMITPDPKHSSSNPAYGFGLQIGNQWNHRYLVHGGGIYGFINQSDYFPDDELVVVVLSNTETSLASALAISIERSLLGLTKDLKIDSPVVEQMVGTYKFVDVPVTFEVTHSNDTLFGHAKFPEKSEPPMKMLYQGNRKFWMNERAAELDFKFSADNKITGLEMRGGGGPIMYAVKQKP